MKSFEFNIEVSRIYQVDVEAKDYQEAILKATDMSSLKISEEGKLKEIWTNIIND